MREFSLKPAMAAGKMVIFILVAFSFINSSNCQDSKGRYWKLLKSSIGISSMHMALLPNSRIVMFDRTDFGRSNISLPFGRCRNETKERAVKRDCSAHSVEFDPATRVVRPLMVLTDTFCSSGALIPNGTLIQTGGFQLGDRVVRSFEPCYDCDWTENTSGLMERRWYATNAVLPDGRIIVIGGRNQHNYEFVPKVAASDYATFDLPFLHETYDWPKKENNLYPFVHLAPDGNLFVFANNKSILLDYVNHRVVKTYPVIPSGCAHNYPSTGSSVLLPIHLHRKDTNVKAEVMICGGTVHDSIWYAEKSNLFLPASRLCGRLVITDESPKWEMEVMPFPRTMGDMVLLPTGDVLIVNGAINGCAGWFSKEDVKPALTPVLYSAAERRFEVLNATKIPRLYHSTAILIPDGRVLVAGSNPNQLYQFTGTFYPTQLSLEAFRPPYLYPTSPRPNITAIDPGTELHYGQKLTIKFAVRKTVTEGGHEVKVTMVAPSFNTHSLSMNQRLLVLEVDAVRRNSWRSYEVDVFAPATANLAPPGYYMVFVVQDGIPSHARWIRIGQ